MVPRSLIEYLTDRWESVALMVAAATWVGWGVACALAIVVIGRLA